MSVACSNCGRAFDGPDTQDGNRLPCPNCGSTSRRFDDGISETVKLRTTLGFKHKRRSVRKEPLAEGVNGWVLRKDDGDLVQKEWLLDRENNRYFEHIETEDGTVIRHCDEPLSE